MSKNHMKRRTLGATRDLSDIFKQAKNQGPISQRSLGKKAASMGGSSNQARFMPLKSNMFNDGT